METIKPKNGASVDPHSAIDSAESSSELKALAITIFSDKNVYPSQHYNILNALFDHPKCMGMVALVKKVMHVFIDEQETKRPPLSPFKLTHFSLSSYEKKAHEEEVSLLFAGSLRTIQFFLKEKIDHLPFDDYTFPLRMNPLSKLDVTGTKLNKKAQQRALHDFDTPALLALRIKRLYIQCVEEGESPYQVSSTTLHHARTEIRQLSKETSLPELDNLYDESLASELKEVFQIVEPEKGDDITESPHVVSDSDMMFDFEDC
ncbi:MAG: hypothetical protein KDK71_09650 [Chlamydiia bacterium]|nr:hypothetical protein [Chlamydiia bacterium]